MRVECMFIAFLVVFATGIRGEDGADEQLQLEKREASIRSELRPCVVQCDVVDPECVRACGVGRNIDFEDFLVQKVAERMILENLDRMDEKVSQYKEGKRQMPSIKDFYGRRQATPRIQSDEF